MSQGKLGLWAAFLEGFTLARPREWVAKKINALAGKKQKEEEEQKRQQEIESFKGRCKRFGWVMAILLVFIFGGLTFAASYLGNHHPYLYDAIIVGKWVFGIGFASYAVLNMAILWERYFNKWARIHGELFKPPLTKLTVRHVFDFWRYMMCESMFFGWCSKIKTVMRKSKQT